MRAQDSDILSRKEVLLSFFFFKKKTTTTKKTSVSSNTASYLLDLVNRDVNGDFVVHYEPVSNC